MTSVPQNRVRPGVPTGGEYAATVHAEPGIALDPSAPAGLEGWPASLPQPEVDIRFDHDGGAVVSLSVGASEINVWADNESTGRLDSGAIGFDDVDVDTMDAAHEAAHKVYRKVAPAIEAEARAAVRHAKARIIAEATGVTPTGPRSEDMVLESPLTPYELGARIDEHGYVTGLAEFEMNELVGSSLDSHLDDLGEKLVGSSLLMDVSGGPVRVGTGGVIVMEITGDAEEIINGFDEDELEQFEAGRASRGADQ